MTDNKLLANYNYSFGQQYKPFRIKPQSDKINTIGIIVYDMGSHFTGNMLKGTRDVADEIGFELIITNSQGSPEKEINNASMLLHSKVDGVIALPCSGINGLSHLDAFKNAGTPIILFDQMQQCEQTDIILIDYHGCGYMATEHLIMQGCKKILMVTDSFNTHNNLQCHKGYMNALKKHHIKYNPEVLMPDANHENAGSSAAGYILQMNQRPDGVFFTNDIEAVSCMQALQESGVSIPRDIAIASCGNTPLSRLASPTLTTIDYPGYNAGRAAANALFSRLNNNYAVLKHKITVIPGNLIVRNSSIKRPIIME